MAGAVSIIAPMWPCRPFTAAHSRWILFLAGGAAESRALTIVRRPTWCLRSIARSDVPASKSRRITAYLSHFCGAGVLDFFSGAAASGPGMPESGRAQFGEGSQDRVRLAACQDGQPSGVDGAVTTAWHGEVSPQVAEAQVVRGGQPAQV